ncbi:anaphase-promoting complex subunit 11 [Pyricularia oryzae Y34]|uniref:Anaphase-promoting complex subunit 11 n=2 Tax=Pyricularia oryzae TaxID=318829 RepID=A0AA97NT02_PYRO3|nr:anaphase-promoting complex subunit 11 [Pyricularia oryzae Y34]
MNAPVLHDRKSGVFVKQINTQSTSQKHTLSRHSFNTPPVFLEEAMKVKIKEWNAVATWRWDIPEDDVCGICQVHFDGTCPTCKYPGDDCSLSNQCRPTFPFKCLANAAIIFTCTASSNGSSKIQPRDNARCVDKSLSGTNSPGNILQALGLQWPRQHSNSSWKRPTSNWLRGAMVLL